MKSKHLECIGPIALSALSLFISFLLIQKLAYFLDPKFDLLASRGLCKVAFVFMVIYQIVLFLFIQPQQFLTSFFKRNLFFFFKEHWLIPFSRFFLSFFSLHALLLTLLFTLGYVVYSPSWGVFNLFLVLKTLFGLFVVFMLAWTEELIFRGTIYPYFTQFYSTFSSIMLTSFIFMLVHNLANPLTLITTEWRLGLGLFLLGLLLNQVFVITKKLYTGMGLHAGLVFVKVVLRRARFLIFVPATQWPWWLHSDLRQSTLVHTLFLIAIIYLFIRHKSVFFKPLIQASLSDHY